MVSFTTAFIAAAVAAGVLAAPVEGPAPLSKRNTPNGQGTDGGYFWQFCACNASIQKAFG
jgi:endo-1,4-beta-xylanase